MSQPVQGVGGALAPNFLTQKQEAIAIATVRFTHPKPPQSILSPSTNPSLPTNSTAAGDSIPRDVTRPGATMPHAYTSHGELHGVIFTVTQSHWDRTSCVLDWPPCTTTGFTTWQASLRQGTLVLTPLPRHHHHHLQGKNSGTKRNGKNTNKKKKRNQEDAENFLEQQQGEQNFKVAETRATDALQSEIHQQQQQQIGIPLEGCTIELVRDGLDGRSEMVRRAPLLLSHTSWPLLGGDKKVFLFATDPAAKQEWLNALSYWCVNSSGDAWEGRIKSIEETYQLFCSMMAQKSTLPSVQEKFPNSLNSFSSFIDTTLNTGSGSREGSGGVLEVGIRGVNVSAVEAGTSSLARRSIDQLAGGERVGGGGDANQKCANKQQFGGKRTSWKRWRKSKREGGEIENEEIEHGADDDVVEILLVSPPPPQGATGAGTAVDEVHAPVEVEPHVATAEDIDSIIEMRWMQSRKVPVPPAPPKQKHQERKSSGGGGGLSNVPSTASSLTASPSLSPVKVPPIGPVVYRQVLPPSQQQQQAGAAGAAGPSTTATPSGSAQASPTKRQQPSSTTQQQSSLPSQPSRLPPGFPSPLLPFDFFINATATRACFDLLRNPAFSEHVRARIQRQISRMHTPDYVTSLEVVSVDPGCTAPTLSKFAAVPQPALPAAFPQLIFDMKYSGSFTVTIECKVDIRDAAAWSALDHAIDRIEGKKKIIKTYHHHHNDIDKKEKDVDDEEGEEDEEEADILADRDSVSDDDDDDDEDEDEDNNDDENDDIYDEEDDEEELLHPFSRSSDSGSSSPSRSIAESPKSDAGPSTIESQHQHPPKRRLLGQLRQKTANKLRKLADSTATRISNLPLRVSLTFSVLEGTMCIWIPPPPGDRLFWSFLSPPKLSLKATPQIGQRVLKYAYHASRASEWIQARLELAFRKNLVFPCGGDIALPFLLPVWNPRAFDGLDGLEKEQTAAAALGVNAARAGARNVSSHGRPPIQVKKQGERNRENGVSVTRVPREDTNGIAGPNSTTDSGGPAGTSSAAAAASAAPFVEFSLRRPPRNNTSE